VLFSRPAHTAALLSAALMASCSAQHIPPISGSWVSENSHTARSLKIVNDDGKMYVSYCFVSNSGNRINCAVDESIDRFRIFRADSPGCYEAEVNSYYEPKLKTDISMCVEGNNLTWTTLREKDIPYLPQRLTFERE
jgi:hypothetical protein